MYKQLLFISAGSTRPAFLSFSFHAHAAFLKTVLFLALAGGLWTSGAAWGQTTYTWNLAGNGSWGTVGNWTPSRITPANNDILVINNGGTKTITDVPTQTIGRLLIQGNTDVTLATTGSVTQTLTISNAETALNIESGSSLSLTGNDGNGNRTLTIAFSGMGNMVAIDGILNLNIAGTGDAGILNTTNSVTLVTGTLVNNGGSVTSTASNLTFASGSTYQHAQNGGNIPLATWNANSTCLITGVTNNTPGNNTQNFGNFTWNCLSQNNNHNAQLSGVFSIQGNLTIMSTGSGNGELRLPTDQANVVAGNYTQSGGIVVLRNNNTHSLTVGGNFTVTGGTFAKSGDDTPGGVLNVAGNFSLTAGGTLAGGNLLNVFFNGSGTQVYTSGGAVTGTTNFTANSGVTLQMATAGTIVSGNSFTLSSGATLGITSPQGITTAACGTGGTCGNIRTTTRTFNAGANYIYNGGGAQNTGNGLPATVNNLTFDNPSWVVTFNASRNITNRFSITTGSVANLGTFTHTANTLELGGMGQTAIGSWGHSNAMPNNPNDVFFTNATGIINISTPLPITLLYFKAEKQDEKTALLSWATATELNNDYMAVERSHDGQVWKEIGRVSGAGTTTVPQAYSLLDENPLPGLNYYRLRQVDYDGVFEYFNTVALDFRSFNLSPLAFDLFPNPAGDRITLRRSQAAPDGELFLLDMQGRVLQRSILPDGLLQKEIDLSGLPAGMYLVRLTAGAQQEMSRFVKE